MPNPLFVSHGAPTLILEPSASREFLAGLAARIGAPRGVIVVSAHWDTAEARVTSGARLATIHDFFGFPEPLYRLNYPAIGAPATADRVVGMLNAVGIRAATDEERGLDHGAWVPLMLALPRAEIPVLQLSIQSRLGAPRQFALGRALRPLVGEGWLVLASGAAVHNLGRVAWYDADRPPPWAGGFQDWLIETVERGDAAALAAYRAAAPFAREAHPTDEHLQPLFVAAGAAAEGWKGRCLHRAFMHGTLGMASFAFEPNVG